MDNKSTTVCSECGSEEVETLMWVNPNTNEIGGTLSEGEAQDNFCKLCQSHNKLITLEEYQKQEEEREGI
jgi:hypothetical protein